MSLLPILNTQMHEIFHPAQGFKPWIFQPVA